MTDVETESEAIFKEAQLLANKGDVDEALLICHRYLSLYGGNARVYFLMGMLQVAARRDEEATRYFQKAVYLDPNHYDGLVNLALLAARRGQTQEAERFWKRARKIATVEMDR
jgi:chemotaxis protein methyltransferase WspC